MKASAFSGGFNEATFRDVWLAGLYEGEGSFSCVRGRLQLQIKMTDEDVLQRVLQVAGVGNLYGPYQRGLAHHKPVWTFIATGDAADSLGDRIHPYLLSRRQAQIERARGDLAAWREQMPSDESRFEAHVVRKDEHLLWTGYLAPNGYGRVWVDGRRADPTGDCSENVPRLDLADRVAWRRAGHELPRRVNLRNLCGLKHCVRPDHWIRADQQCLEGHLIEGDNVLLTKNGKYTKRSCWECHRQRSRAAKERARGSKLSI